MTMNGKAFLTVNGLMLDEVKSLLQKALRRKDEEKVLLASAELLRGSQLHWHRLLTYLFEDHCLSGSDVLTSFIVAHARNEKGMCIELLLRHCKTCRIAACLPIITLKTKYLPGDFDKDLKVDTDIAGLVQKRYGCMRIDLLLAHLRRAWRQRNPDKILSYMKLVTASSDKEMSKLTDKGRSFAGLGKGSEGNAGLIALKMLFLDTSDGKLKTFIGQCFRLATEVVSAPIQLILFTVVTHLLFEHEVDDDTGIELLGIDWRTVGKLRQMPDWAVDRNTFRGMHGKPSGPLLKSVPKKMSSMTFHEFHGSRRKQGIDEFFQEGETLVAEAVPLNPFRTSMIKMCKKHEKGHHEKRVSMTHEYVVFLREYFPDLFLTSGVKVTVPGENYSTRTPAEAKAQAKTEEDGEKKANKHRMETNSSTGVQALGKELATSPTETATKGDETRSMSHVTVSGEELATEDVPPMGEQGVTEAKSVSSSRKRKPLMELQGTEKRKREGE